MVFAFSVAARDTGGTELGLQRIWPGFFLPPKIHQLTDPYFLHSTPPKRR